MPIRFHLPISIFAQRVSFQSTCVKIRTTFSGVLSVKSGQETKSDYYCEEFSIRTSKTTSNNNCCEISVPSSSSKSLETRRMPVVAAVVAHRRLYPSAASALVSSTAGSKRSSCAVRISALNILATPLGAPGLSGVSKKSSHIHSSCKYTSSSGGTLSAPVIGITGKGTCRPLVELKQLGHLLATPQKGATAVLVESRRYYAKGKDKPKSKKSIVVVNEDEMGEVIDVDIFRKQLQKLIEQMKEEYTKQFSIRGAAGALESLQVEFEGETYPLQELAQVGRKNPQLAVLNCASLPDALKPILKAIEDSGMNLNPQQEGTTIYVPLPKVTREHRETLAKNAKAMFMKYKVAMQGVQNKYVKQCRAQKDLSEDLVFNVQNQIMKFTENYITEAEGLMQLKQKELLDTK